MSLNLNLNMTVSLFPLLPLPGYSLATTISSLCVTSHRDRGASATSITLVSVSASTAAVSHVL